MRWASILFGGTEDGFGTTANHSGGAVPGPNDLQNYPVITSVSVAGATTTVLTGTLNSTANRSFLLDFYRDPAPDKSGHGQGQIYEGSLTITTAANGNTNFSYAFNNSVTNHYYSATATDAATGLTCQRVQRGCAIDERRDSDTADDLRAVHLQQQRGFWDEPGGERRPRLSRAGIHEFGHDELGELDEFYGRRDEFCVHRPRRDEHRQTVLSRGIAMRETPSTKVARTRETQTSTEAR